MAQYFSWRWFDISEATRPGESGLGCGFRAWCCRSAFVHPCSQPILALPPCSTQTVRDKILVLFGCCSPVRLLLFSPSREIQFATCQKATVQGSRGFSLHGQERHWHHRSLYSIILYIYIICIYIYYIILSYMFPNVYVKCFHYHGWL